MSTIRPLSPLEIRVLGVLSEKQRTVPDSYPLTLNALVSGCNQKTSRHPLMEVSEADVQSALDSLRALSLVNETSGGRVYRYAHNIDGVLRIPSQSIALLTVLMLRGPQTAGELRIASERMHNFADISSVEAFLEEMAARSAGALVRKLQRLPGARESRWTHLLGGDDPAAAEPSAVEPPPARRAAARPDDEVWRARVHLAAANRLAVYDDLEEGIDNHFTMCVPGQRDRYLVLPFGLHWSEARASDLIVFNEAGEVLEGDGTLEQSALSIHAPLHRITGANVVLHTHQTWALALNMLDDNRLLPGSQTAAFLSNGVAYDDGYSGIADSLSEGERLASVLGDKHTLFMKNHGVLVVGDTVAQAYRRLYKLERVCRAQVLAMSTGRPLAVLDAEMVRKIETPNPRNSHSQDEREALYFAAMMRVLDREMPGYAD